MPSENEPARPTDAAAGGATQGQDEPPGAREKPRAPITALFPGAASAEEIQAQLTERQQIEESLRENEERLRLAVEAGEIGTCDWNYPAGNMRWNGTRFRMYGLEPQNRIVHVDEFYAVVHPDDRERVQRVITEGVEGRGEHSEEYRVVRPDGTIRWITETGRVVEWKDGKPLRVISVLFDVTERHTSEAAVRKSEETLRLVLENAREYAIVSTDLEHRVTTWNAGAERLLGYQEGEIMGRTVTIMDTADDLTAGRPELESRRALAEGRVAHQSWHVRKDGSRFWASGVLMVMRDAHDKAVGFVKVFRDETRELRVKEELERSREELRAALQEAEHARAEAEAAGQAKDHFLAVLSHELRTPLTPVLMAIHLLGRDRSLPEATREALDMIRRNVQIEARFIDDLLDLTRITRGKLEVVRETIDLHEVVRRAVEVTTPDLQEKRQPLTVELDAARHHLHGDGNRLQQALWNLFKNASKFTPAGGAIRIVSGNEPAGRIVIEVTDSGIGLDADAAQRVFKPFEQAGPEVTREFGGLGLGLAISKAIIDAHGGEIRTRSPGPGQGTTFTVSLPLLTGN